MIEIAWDGINEVVKIHFVIILNSLLKHYLFIHYRLPLITWTWNWTNVKHRAGLQSPLNEHKSKECCKSEIYNIGGERFSMRDCDTIKIMYAIYTFILSHNLFDNFSS